MKKAKILLVALFFCALIVSCGRKDRCPQVHKDSSTVSTFTV